MSDERWHMSTVCVLAHKGAVGTIDLGEGQRVVMLVRGRAPVDTGLEGPGQWNVDTEVASEDATYPIMIITIPSAHLPIFMAMELDVVGAILDSIGSQQESVH